MEIIRAPREVSEGPQALWLYSYPTTLPAAPPAGGIPIQKSDRSHFFDTPSAASGKLLVHILRRYALLEEQDE